MNFLLALLRSTVYRGNDDETKVLLRNPRVYSTSLRAGTPESPLCPTAHARAVA